MTCSSCRLHLRLRRLPLTKWIQILDLLREGSSMRAISRVADVSINSVSKLRMMPALAAGLMAELHDTETLSGRAPPCDAGGV